MVDIDDFKGVNVTYGHIKGDEVLMETASVLVRTCRDIDVVAHFGGDEFTIVLPETGLLGARSLAESIWGNIKRHRYDTGHGFAASLSVSIGIAGYPDHGKHDAELVKLADRALLTAKSAGKDRVDIARPTASEEEPSN